MVPGSIKSPRHPIYKDQLQNIRMEKRPRQGKGICGEHASQKTKKLTKNRPHPRPLSQGERGACFTKNKKTSPKHDLTPGPSPMGRGAHASQKTKNLTKTHKKAPPLQRPKPHHLMKCEKGAWRSHVPFSHFGGRGGTSSPHKKNSTGVGELRPPTEIPITFDIQFPNA